MEDLMELIEELGEVATEVPLVHQERAFSSPI